MSWITEIIRELTVAGVVALGESTRKPVKADAQGWKRLKAGWFINSVIFGSAVMSGFFGYIWLFVGSARSDAETQMLSALGLSCGFGLATCYLLWTFHGKSVAWRHGNMQIKYIFLPPRTVAFADVDIVLKNNFLGFYKVVFKSGSVVRIPKEMHGIEQLLAKLPRKQFSSAR